MDTLVDALLLLHDPSLLELLLLLSLDLVIEVGEVDGLLVHTHDVISDNKFFVWLDGWSILKLLGPVRVEEADLFLLPVNDLLLLEDLLLVVLDLFELGSGLLSSFIDDLVLLGLSLLLFSPDGESLLLKDYLALLVHVDIRVPEHKLGDRLSALRNSTQDTLALEGST